MEERKTEVSAASQSGEGFARTEAIWSEKEKKAYLEDSYNSVGKTIGADEAHSIVGDLLEKKIINRREAEIMMAPLTNAALFILKPEKYRDHVRANILRHIIWALMI